MNVYKCQAGEDHESDPQAENSVQEGVQVREALVGDVDEVSRVPEVPRAPLENLLACAEVDGIVQS